MAKNRTMQMKHLKAKQEGIKITKSMEQQDILTAAMYKTRSRYDFLLSPLERHRAQATLVQYKHAGLI